MDGDICCISSCM